MKFFDPQKLTLLLLVPVFLGLLYFHERRRRKQFARFADSSLWKLLSPELNFGLRLRKSILGLLALLFGLIALARPQWGSHEETVKVTGLDVVLVLDISNSMYAEDVVPSRIQKMKHWVKTLLGSLEGDRVGVVAFAASTAVVCPLTSDLAHVWDTVQILDPKMMQNQGTDVGLALQTASAAMDRGAEESGASSQAPVASRVVILISDGEDHEKQALTEADRIKEKGIQFFVLGVGTDKGGPIPLRDESNRVVGYKRDRKGNVVVSSFRNEFLSNLAERGSGKYWTASVEEAEIQDLNQQLRGLTRGEYAERRFLVFEDRFQIPLMIAVILLFLELSVPVRNLLPILLIGCFLAFQGEVRADSLVQLPSTVESYLENQKGLKAFRRGDLEEAQRHFNSAQALDPEQPELEFNQGVLRMNQGLVARAIDSFKRSAQIAERLGRYDLRDKALYNLAMALEKKGDTKEAIQGYLDAIETSQKQKDVKIEEAARKNLQLIQEKLKNQSKSQEQQENLSQSQSGGESQKEKSEKPKDDSEKKDPSAQKQESREQKQVGAEKKQESQEKKQDEGKGQENKPVSRKKNEFKSQKLAPEDADRVLSELQARERELREKMQKRNGTQQNQPQDW